MQQASYSQNFIIVESAWWAVKKKVPKHFPNLRKQKNYLYRIFSVIQTVFRHLPECGFVPKLSEPQRACFNFGDGNPEPPHASYSSVGNLTISLGVQSKAWHSFSSVNMVMLLFFRKVSNTLLSNTLSFISLYCVISFLFMVYHNGL